MTETVLIANELMRVARDLGVPSDSPPSIERPRDPRHGDWATNFAMTLARSLRRKPMEIAADIVSRLDPAAAGVREAVVAAPGFINFRLDSGQLAGGLTALIAAGGDFGKSNDGQGRRVVVEFVSANPTGPLHVGHGRQAALGDSIATLLEWTGWSVSREFYYNDAGAQIEKLAQSLIVRAAELEGIDAAIPEGGYHGEYIREIARRFIDSRTQRLTADLWRTAIVGIGAESAAGAGEADDRGSGDAALLDEARHFAVTELRAEQDADLRTLGVAFDTYYLETSLYTSGRVDSTIELLRKRGMLYEHEHALWLRSTEFGDDKDRVARKRDGSYTYFLPDVAYHVTKWERGFERAIDVQGADHHSTVTRVRAGLQALGIGIPPGYPDYVLHQLVTVMSHGEEVKISKRAGSYVTVRDLVDWVGRDAVRYFFLMRKGDSQLVFDIDLARSQSEENPVYYIQMANARMRGIFRVGSISMASVTGFEVDLSALETAEERELIKQLLDFPGMVRAAALALEPHRVAAFLLELSRKVHLWYHKEHVLLDGNDVRIVALREARLVLACAAATVLQNGLRLLGISAPERM
jgi:arginyl-tRNA synthetase